MLRNFFIGFLLWFLLPTNTYGQTNTDSNKQLSLETYLKWVSDNHPLAKQAKLIEKSANANLLAARGNFDPKLYYDLNSKRFDDKNYYNLNTTGIKIPTWFGVEAKTGFENNSGVFLNEENRTPSNGLIYAQLSVPLLQGLLIDERRTALKQAQLLKQSTASEIRVKLNELYYQAGKAYFDWLLANNNLLVSKDAYDISTQRLTAVVKNALLGDRPLIDTVEALIQQQDRLINLKQNELDVINKRMIASSFLWLDNNMPVALDAFVLPLNVDSSSTGKLKNPLLTENEDFNTSIDNHPFLQNYQFKIRQLQTDKRLKQEKLKPALDFLYNPLFDASNNNLTFFNNYKWGIAFSFPLLLRKERGEVRQANIKIQTAGFELQNKRNELLVKANNSLRENKNLRDQFRIYKANVVNYEKLWRSEKISFENGESSLFMINSREMSFMNAKIKLNELENKWQKSLLEVNYNLGLLRFD